MTDVTAQYENDAFTTITNVALEPANLVITVASGGGAKFPNVGAPNYFYATLEDAVGQVEIVKVTEHLANGDTFTVERAQDNTPPGTFVSGDYFEMRPNAAIFEEFRDAIATKENIVDVDIKLSAATALYLPLIGGAVTGQIKGVSPLANDDLARKDYVDNSSMGRGFTADRHIRTTADIPSTDANLIVLGGFYACDATILNLPGSKEGALVHFNEAGTHYYQVFYERSTTNINEIWTRQYNGVWSSWRSTVRANNYASSTVGGTVKMRVSGSNLFITNNGNNA